MTPKTAFTKTLLNTATNLHSNSIIFQHVNFKNKIYTDTDSDPKFFIAIHFL